MNDEIEKLKREIEARDALIGELQKELNLWVVHIGQKKSDDEAQLDWLRARDLLARTPADVGAELERLRRDVNVQCRRAEGAEEYSTRVMNNNQILRAQLATAEARLRTKEGYIDQISLACGFPIVENREQVTDTIIKRIANLTAKAEQLRTVTEAADAMHRACNVCLYEIGMGFDEDSVRKINSAVKEAVVQYTETLDEVLRLRAARSGNLPAQTDHEGRPMTYWGGLAKKPGDLPVQTMPGHCVSHCELGQSTGITCPDDGCDIDTGVRSMARKIHNPKNVN